MGAGAEVAGAAKGRILIVDDDPGVRQMVRYLLDGHAYHCEVAEDGLQALARLQHGGFDVVLTDFLMPRLDGLALLQEVRRMAHAPPVIVQTSVLDPSLEKVFWQAGAFRVLLKGAPLVHLLGAVSEACRASRSATARCA